MLTAISETQQERLEKERSIHARHTHSANQAKVTKADQEKRNDTESAETIRDAKIKNRLEDERLKQDRERKRKRTKSRCEDANFNKEGAGERAEQRGSGSSKKEKGDSGRFC
jgi:hypothetical protein